MTIREDAASMYANKVTGGGLPCKVTHNPKLEQFISEQPIPRSSNLSEHKICWHNMFKAFDKRMEERQ